MNDSLQKVLTILQEKGYTDDQLADFTENLTQSAFARLYGTLMASLTEDELIMLDGISDQEQANAKIKELYLTQVGKDPETEIATIIGDFANGFLVSYEKEKITASAPSTPQTQ